MWVFFLVNGLVIAKLYIFSLNQCVKSLEQEIGLEYGRTMNRINFDKVVTSQPEQFSDIILPQKEDFAPKRRESVYVDLTNRYVT